MYKSANTQVQIDPLREKKQEERRSMPLLFLMIDLCEPCVHREGKTFCHRSLLKKMIMIIEKDDFQSVLYTFESLFAFFVLFHVRHHKI